MKKSFITLLLALLLLFTCIGCNSPTDDDTPPISADETYTVTFRQSGQEDIVISVKKGEKLSNIPFVTQKVGYIVSWKNEDLAKLSDTTEDVVIYATETAKTYNVIFDCLEDKLTVTYGEPYNLPTLPSNSDYEFKCWHIDGESISTSGDAWSIDHDGDIILVAEWKSLWTPNF